MIKSPFVFVAVSVLALACALSLEVAALRRAQDGVDGLGRENAAVEIANRRLTAELSGLRSSRPRIEALYLRLRDSVAPPRALLATADRPAPRPGEPEVLTDRALQGLNDAGVITQPTRTAPGEMARVYEAGASRLEMQRLIPLLAEQENSNTFLFIDRLVLSRPSSVPAFSKDPTYLDTRFTFRILTAR